MMDRSLCKILRTTTTGAKVPVLRSIFGFRTNLFFDRWVWASPGRRGTERLARLRPYRRSTQVSSRNACCNHRDNHRVDSWRKWSEPLQTVYLADRRCRLRKVCDREECMWTLRGGRNTSGELLLRVKRSNAKSLQIIRRYNRLSNMFNESWPTYGDLFCCRSWSTCLHPLFAKAADVTRRGSSGGELCEWTFASTTSDRCGRSRRMLGWGKPAGYIGFAIPLCYDVSHPDSHSGMQPSRKPDCYHV